MRAWRRYAFGALAAVPMATVPAGGTSAGQVVVGATATDCAPNLADELAATHGARQVVTVEAADDATTVARLVAWRRVGSCFVRVTGPYVARIGAAGLSAHHVEGDDTTPIGAYAIGPTMYGIAPDPGVAYPYHRLVCGDWWDEDPSSPEYNTFQHVACGQTPPFGGNSEALWTEAPDYEHFAVIEYDTDPVVPGRGSGIFLHVATGSPTTGCVALPEPELDLLLRWLRPGDHPLVVIGPAASIRSL